MYVLKSRCNRVAETGFATLVLKCCNLTRQARVRATSHSFSARNVENAYMKPLSLLITKKACVDERWLTETASSMHGEIREKA